VTPNHEYPSHPGFVLRQVWIQPAGLGIRQVAHQLGVSRNTLSNLINGHSGLSAQMAIRLEQHGWGYAEQWLQLQLQFDLYIARQKGSNK